MRKPRPSSTAWFIGAATVYMAEHPRLGKLVPAAAVEPTRACLRAGGGWRRLLVPSFGRPWFRRLVERYESRIMPGIALHIGARKRYMEETVRRAITQGFRQVVILGAGYDTLALRLHTEFPKVVFLEVDRPVTQAVKLRAAMGPYMPAANLGLVGADLSKRPLLQALADSPLYQPRAETLFVAEGLLMYLSAADVATLFDGMRAQGGRRGRVVFTFLEPGPDGRAALPRAGPRIDRWLRRQGEEFRWGVTRDGLSRWAADRGYAVTDVAGAQTFRQRLLSGIVPEDEPLAAGEYACTADRA